MLHLNIASIVISQVLEVYGGKKIPAHYKQLDLSMEIYKGSFKIL